jgi:hypothetical protein
MWEWKKKKSVNRMSPSFKKKMCWSCEREMWNKIWWVNITHQNFLVKMVRLLRVIFLEFSANWLTKVAKKLFWWGYYECFKWLVNVYNLKSENKVVNKNNPKISQALVHDGPSNNKRVFNFESIIYLIKLE